MTVQTYCLDHFVLILTKFYMLVKFYMLKIENMKEQTKVWQKIQDLVKNYKEPNLTLFMSHPETKTVKIQFLKKNESDLPRIKFSSYNPTTKENVDFFFYDYIGHFKKFGFNWKQNDLGLEYNIKINDSTVKEIQKRLTLNSSARKKSVWMSLESGT